MSDLVIRAPRADDAESLARLVTQLGYPAATDDIPARLERFYADAGARAFVAEKDDALLGLITIHLRHTLNHEAPIAQITLLVVDETHRTAGVGRALVEAAEGWAHVRGAKRVAVTTALDRAVAHSFYEKVGFRHTGRRYAKDFSL